MIIETPKTIESIAWEGELEAPESMRAAGAARVRATIGQPECWRATEALEIKTGEKWTPPVADKEFWLLRLACTVHPLGRFSSIVEGQLSLSLDSAYAFSLYPDRLGAEDQREFSLSLGPKLKFGNIQAEGGSAGGKIVYRKVFPVIQSYGVGEPGPYWLFKPHSAHPLEGSQFVYAVVATAGPGIRGDMVLTVSIDTDFGLIRLGLPRQARAATRFSLP